MQSIERRQTPGVRGGRVKKKNSHAPHVGNYYCREQQEVVIDRQRPGEGYRHLLTVRDIRRFLAILPNWEELSEGLNAVVLAAGAWGWDGWHRRGIVAVCAWERSLWCEYAPDYVTAHQGVLDRLGVPCRQIETEEGKIFIRCEWDERAARAFQLLHVLLHELGHHHDRITTASRRRASRGEPFAEDYALRYESILWDRYWQEFER